MSSEPNELDLRRVNVVGVSGSGKSTFARRLAAQLGSDYIEMDAVYWGPQWTEPSDDVFFPRLHSVLQRERWVLDGNYSRTTPIKWPRATLVVWLDYPLLLTACRAVRRAVYRAFTQRELWPGTNNRETFSQLFSRKSIVLWTLNTHARVRLRYEAQMKGPPFSHLRFVRLRSPRQAERFLLRLAGRDAPR